MPSVSARAMIIRARKIGEYMNNSVIPALAPAYAELQAQGKVPAYMKCGKAIYAAARLSSDKDMLENMCIALSDGKQTQLMTLFTTAMDNLNTREIARAQKSAADWALFDADIRPRIEEEFAHAQAKGYIGGKVRFAAYWEDLASNDRHAPFDKDGAPVDFPFADMLTAHASGDPAALAKAIYDVMAKKTNSWAKHVEHYADYVRHIKDAAQQLKELQSPAARQQRADDIKTLRQFDQGITKPTVMETILARFNIASARDAVIDEAKAAYARIMEMDKADVMLQHLMHAGAKIDTLTDPAQRICEKTRLSYHYLLDSYDRDTTPTRTQIIKAAGLDFSGRRFPPYSEYGAERPQPAVLKEYTVVITAPRLNLAKPEGLSS